MKKKRSTILFILLFLIGLSLLLYPYLANRWNHQTQDKQIDAYHEHLDKQDGIDYQAEKERAQRYNATLAPSIYPDSFAIAAASEVDSEYMACLNLAGDGMMGYISIPKIDVELPLFHTTSAEVMEIGVGHLQGSSLPVGGNGTHAVFSAHRGTPNATLFTDLDKVVEGDHFYLYVLGEVLCYEVDQILVVTPTETAALAAEEGKDFVTLITCTPYGVNSHRLLVRGHRIEYSQEDVLTEQDAVQASWYTNYIFWVVVGLLTVAGFTAFLYWKEKRSS